MRFRHKLETNLITGFVTSWRGSYHLVSEPRVLIRYRWNGRSKTPHGSNDGRDEANVERRVGAAT
ncbi:hypothetical protein TIFTF001_039352 [Ficus carica]|uniref:Uncharacterized protein n=1 Tax=Ficus carica TaxID=3494 RepID=A0AA88EEL7_FICCA|nr:hypothetical protein TIFTF001_039352 [Ficus carica]